MYDYKSTLTLDKCNIVLNFLYISQYTHQITHFFFQLYRCKIGKFEKVEPKLQTVNNKSYLTGLHRVLNLNLIFSQICFRKNGPKKQKHMSLYRLREPCRKPSE